jgi:hypothetical protein
MRSYRNCQMGLQHSWSRVWYIASPMVVDRSMN